MKKFLLFLALFFLVGVSHAQVLFDTYSYDFGTIEETGGEVSHTFKFRNEGKEPFVITLVSVSCGCTTPTYSTKSIEPDELSDFKVVFDPKDRPGRFEKFIYIKSNLEKDITLVVKGYVKPRPRTIEDDYPYIISLGVRLNSMSLNVEHTHIGRDATRMLGVANTSSALSAVVEFEPAEESSNWIKVEPSKQIVAPGARLNVAVTMQSARFGLRQGELYVSINGERQAEKVWVSAVFTRDFSGMSSTEIRDGAKLELSKFFYHFSTQKKGEKLSYDVILKNTGGSELVIDHLESSSADLCFAADKKVLRRDEKTILKIEYTPTQIGTKSEVVRIITNDPQNPVREFRVMANIIQ